MLRKRTDFVCDQGRCVVLTPTVTIRSNARTWRGSGPHGLGVGAASCWRSCCWPRPAGGERRRTSGRASVSSATTTTARRPSGREEEPLAFKGKAHFATLKQLDGTKAAGFARALGIDPFDLKGSCVKCHATVFRGDANAGVSCESCHGPASGWNELHQQKGSYAKAVAAGMHDLRDKPAAIARVCVECHVVSDRRLAAAGHPTGEAFDAGASLQKLVHWNRGYDFAQVSAAGRSAGAGRAPAPAAAARGGAAARTRAARPRRPRAQRPRPRRGTGISPSGALPQDYVPDPVAAPGTAAPARPSRVATTVPLSLAEDVPVPRTLSTPTPAASPASPRLRPRSAEIAELRGRAAVLLERLLRAGARSPGAAAPTRPLEFAGPDGELLRLQDEAIALALESVEAPVSSSADRTELRRRYEERLQLRVPAEVERAPGAVALRGPPREGARRRCSRRCASTCTSAPTGAARWSCARATTGTRPTTSSRAAPRCCSAGRPPRAVARRRACEGARTRRPLTRRAARGRARRA